MATDLPNRHAAEDPSTPVAVLRQSLADLMDEARRLRVDVHGAEVARKRANHINLGVLGLLALFTALLVAIGYQNNQLGRQNNDLAKQVAAGNAVMADCTTPGGRCYEESRARLGGAISAVVQISVFVSQCGRLYPGESGPEYDAKLSRCVSERLAAAAAQPTPGPVPASPSPSTPR